MKLTLTKEALTDGLQKVQAIVNPRTTLPILSNVLVKAEGDRLWLTTTDLEVSVKTSIEAEVQSEGATTLPARKFFSIIRELPSHDVDIELEDESTVSIRCGSSFFKLVGMPEDDFPPLPAFEEGKTYSLGRGAFNNMLQKTAYAASNDETRYVLNGVLLHFESDKLVVVATDGRRLALVESEVEFPAEAEGDMILPSKTVSELIKTLGDEGELKVRATGTQIAFEFGDMLVVSKLIDGTYPNFRQVIPSSSEHRIAVEREGLLTAVRRVALMTVDQTNSIKLTFGNNRLEITAVTPEIGEARESLPVKFDQDPVSIAFNPEFLMNPLRTLDTDEIFVEMTDELSPGVFKSTEPFLYVLMPMRLS